MATPETSSTVIVIGCGIVGPVLALLLKQKGYRPVIVEKVREIGAAGIALGPAPNGLKVLNLVGLAKKVLDGLPRWVRWDELSSSGEILGHTESPAHWQETYGWPAVGSSRTKLQHVLKDAVIEAGIELHTGFDLSEIRETVDGKGIVAIAEDGRSILGSFLAGCDGLKATSRDILFRKMGLSIEPPEFTGLLLQGGLSPTPEALLKEPGMDIIYGPGSCMLTYVIDGGLSNWALYSQIDQKQIETWRLLDSEALELQKKKLIDKYESEKWPDYVIQLIAGAQKMIQNGLYDRAVPAPEHWFHERCVLVGDSAHPTSPHLGQGANQGFEDIWHLCQLLPDYEEGAGATSLSTEELGHIFHNYAKTRKPRTEMMVKAARFQGDIRTVKGGPEVYQERNEKVRMAWKDHKVVEERFDNMYNEPFKYDG